LKEFVTIAEPTGGNGTEILSRTDLQNRRSRSRQNVAVDFLSTST